MTPRGSKFEKKHYSKFYGLCQNLQGKSFSILWLIRETSTVLSDSDRFQTMSLSHYLTLSLFFTHTLSNTHSHTHTLFNSRETCSHSPYLSLSVSLSLYISFSQHPCCQIQLQASWIIAHRPKQEEICKAWIFAKQVGEEIFSSDDGFYS